MIYRSGLIPLKTSRKWERNYPGGHANRPGSKTPAQRMSQPRCCRNVRARCSDLCGARDEVLLCCSEASLASWCVDEIRKALAKERHLHKERGDKVLAIIPLNLDGYLFESWKDGKAQLIKDRLAADFSGWEMDNAKFEAEFKRVVAALQTGSNPGSPARRFEVQRRGASRAQCITWALAFPRSALQSPRSSPSEAAKRRSLVTP